MIDAPPNPWSFTKLTAFRVWFAYIAVYFFPGPIAWLPYVDELAAKYSEGVTHVASAWGELALGVVTDPSMLFNGSGDRTIDYVLHFFTLSCALVIAAMWTAIDRRRTDHDRLAFGLWVFLRYALAFTMFGYGFAKVIQSQFPYPSPARLQQSIGDSTPMGLLWTMMGYSKGYNFVTGAVECLGGALLLFRRTSTLGALVTAGAMVNIVALNFFYDVPVKLYSTHLLAFAIAVAMPDLHRLANVLVFQRPTTPAAERPPLPKRWQRRARVVIKYGLIAWTLYTNYTSNAENLVKRTTIAPELAAFHDAFWVESHTVSGVESTSASRWVGFAAGRYGTFFVTLLDRTSTTYNVTVNEAARTIELVEAKPAKDAKPKTMTFRYAVMYPDRVALAALVDQTPVHIVLRRSSWRLDTTGFHWINEFPNNR